MCPLLVGARIPAASQGGQGGRRARERRLALHGTVAIGMPVSTRRRRRDDGEPATPPGQARPNQRARGQSEEPTPFATPATHPPPALPPPATASPTAVDQAPTTDDGLSRWLRENVDPDQLNALFADAEGAVAQPLAQPDAAVPVDNPANVIQILQGRGELPEAARAYLIDLCHKAIDTQVLHVPPGTKLVQCDISIPKPDSGFPHLVKRNGALSDEAEAAVWEQYKTKFTIIKVQLLDAQGAPPPRSYPM